MEREGEGSAWRAEQGKLWQLATEWHPRDITINFIWSTYRGEGIGCRRGPRTTVYHLIPLWVPVYDA